jgi:hypothetical protein
MAAQILALRLTPQLSFLVRSLAAVEMHSK